MDIIKEENKQCS